MHISHLKRTAFYRSNFLRAVFAIGGLVASWALQFGSHKWHTTPSLRFIHELGLSWSVFAVGFLLYSVLLLSPQPALNELGFWAGLFLYAIFIISVAITIRPDRPTNLTIVVLGVDGLVAHYAAARLAHLDRDRSE